MSSVDKQRCESFWGSMLSFIAKHMFWFKTPAQQEKLDRTRGKNPKTCRIHMLSAIQRGSARQGATGRK